MDVREDTDDDCYEDAREENEGMRGSPHAACCERVRRCSTEVKDDGCSRKRENNPLPFRHLFRFSSPGHSSSTSRLSATSSLFCDSLSHIPHHAFLHPGHRISLDDFLSSVFRETL